MATHSSGIKFPVTRTPCCYVSVGTQPARVGNHTLLIQKVNAALYTCFNNNEHTSLHTTLCRPGLNMDEPCDFALNRNGVLSNLHWGESTPTAPMQSCSSTTFTHDHKKHMPEHHSNTCHWSTPVSMSGCIQHSCFPTKAPLDPIALRAC